jgi:hypothetical protein
MKQYKAQIIKAMVEANKKDAELAGRRSEANGPRLSDHEDAGRFLINVIQPILDGVAREVKEQAGVHGLHVDCRTGGDSTEGGKVFLSIAAHTLMFENFLYGTEPIIKCTGFQHGTASQQCSVGLTEKSVHEVLEPFIELALIAEPHIP